MESFTWLCDNIPEWTSKLDNLSQVVQARQDEFERMSLLSSGTTSRLAKRKTGSTESLRPDDGEPTTLLSSQAQASLPTDTAPTTALTPIQTPKLEVNPNNRRLFQEYRDAARRKRKSGSIQSGASGPARFRARTSMVVYYDSEVQQGFESLVRCLASARNTLRKGKNVTSYKARMQSLVEEESPFDQNRSEMSIRNPKVARFQKSSGPFSMDSLSLEQFDLIDKELEVAQTLCEIGAHQFLRDATSSDELAGVRDKLDVCLKLAREGSDIMNRELEERKFLEQAVLARKPSADGKKSESAMTSDSKAFTESAMGIEIDDDDEDGDGVSIDLSGNDNVSIDLPGPKLDIEIPTTVELDTSAGSIDIAHPRVDHVPAVVKETKSDNDYSAGMIEVDDGDSDTESFHVDMSTMRRTRG